MTPVELEKAAASETVRWAHDDLDLAYSAIGLAVDTNERTVRRWQSREVAPRGPHRAKLEGLRELRHLLQAVFETKQDADRWLHAPMPAFRGRVWRHVQVGAEPLHLGLTSEAAIAEFEKHLATYPAPPGWGAVR